MKKRVIGIALSIVMIVLVVFGNPVSLKAANILDTIENIFGGGTNSNNFTITAESGYGNSISANEYLPVRLTVTNHGNDFEGKIRVIFPSQDNNNVMYQKDMVLSSGAKGTYTITGYLVSGATRYNIQIVDKKDKVVYSQIQNLTVQTDSKDFLIGILSDDYSAVSYMNNNPLWSEPDRYTKTVELSADFSDDYHALMPLDVIVISNFSTDYLTEGQIDALGLWVQNGGVLMIGTGSQSNKTLSKLNGTLVECSPASLEKVTTDLGATVYLNDFNSATYYSGSSYYNTDADYQYTVDFDALYTSQEGLELIDKVCLDAFADTTGYGTDKDTWPSYLESDYYYFAWDYFRDYYDQVIVAGNNQGYGYDFTSQNVDMIVFDNIKYDGVYSVTADNAASKDLCYASSVGLGTIAVFTIDFTMNPMPRYDGATTVFMKFIYDLCEVGVYSRANKSYSSYYSSYNDGKEKEVELTENIGGAPLPPIVLYGLIILVYFIFIFILFFRQKKKGNMIKLWNKYLVLSGIIMLCVVALSFITRNLRTRLDVATINILDNGVRYENNYITATVPRAMNETIKVNNEYALDLFDIYEYGYWGSMTQELEDYKIGIYEKSETNEIVLGQTGALGQAHFEMSRTVVDTRDIDIQANFSSIDYDIKVRNDYGCDLENCVVIYSDGYNIWPIMLGNIKAGDTATANGRFAQMKSQYIYTQNPVTGASYITRSSGIGVLGGLLFGSLSPQYRKMIQRGSIASYAADVIDDYNYYNYNSNGFNYEAVFVGFPKEKVQDTIQQGNKYNIKRTTSVMKFVK